MNDIKSALQKVVEDLPADASWDCLWESVIAASRHASAESPEPNLELFTTNITRTSTVSPTSQALQAPEEPSQIDPGGNHTKAKLTPEELARKGTRLKIAAFVVVGLGFAFLAYLDTWITEVSPYARIFVQVYTPAFLYVAFLRRLSRELSPKV